MNASEVRGFNYSGSWGTSGLDLWLYHDHGKMAVEVGRGKSFFPKWNVARWWLSHEAYIRAPDRFLANFEAGLSIFARYNILVMPVLFNRWRDPSCDFGGVSLEHIIPGMNYLGAGEESFNPETPVDRPVAGIEGIMRRYLGDLISLHRNDERIYAWDLCNEPFGAYLDIYASPLLDGEMRWLIWCSAMCKLFGASQPLTIGNHFLPQALRLTAPICDLLSFHPYYMHGQPEANQTVFERTIDECIKVANDAGKELLASETVWGNIVDGAHVSVMRYTLGELKSRGLGWIVHALQHSLVADLHLPAYGPVGSASYMAFVNPDGHMRAGHDVFNDL
jgi:hypothetical protein